MRRLMSLLTVLAACVLVAAPATLAQDGTGARVALVIGNAQYEALPARFTAADDALAVADELRWIGFDVVEGFDLSAPETEAALQQFEAMLDGAEIALFYFAGHGTRRGDVNYLLPVDTRAEQGVDALRDALALERVQDVFERPGLTGVVLIDAAPIDPLGLPGEEGVSGLAPVSPRPGQVVAMARARGAVTYDGGGPYSAFTEALLMHMAAPDDIATMLGRVRDEVIRLTDGQQMPVVSLPGLFPEGGVGGAFTGALVGQEPLLVIPESFPSLAGPMAEEPAAVYAYEEAEDAAPEDATSGDAASGDEGGAVGSEPPQPSDDASMPEPALEVEPEPLPPPVAAQAPPPPVAAQAPPPPVAAQAPLPADVEVTRYPTMDLPERVLPGEPFPLMVWLSRTPITPEVAVTAGPGSSVDESGALTMVLPESGDWAFRVVLNAPGFRIGGGAGPVAEIAMAADGDSSPAFYLLTAEPGAHPDGQATIHATLWHDATFLASLERTVLVGADAVAPGVAEAALAPEAGFTIEPGYRTADLTMRVDYADPANLGAGQVIVASPHFQTPLIVGQIDTPASVSDWLAFQYGAFIQARNQDRARGAQRPGEAPGEQLTRPLMRGFGQELYSRFAPEVFKDALWALVDVPGTPIATIQIYSNNPVLPWELMRPLSADGTRELGYLGVDFEVARWHGADDPSMFDRPRQALAFEELVAIAPHYEGGAALESVEAELASLREMPGFREVPGRFGAVQSLFAAPPRGIVHFAGHGVVSDAPAPSGPRSYMIRLEDLDLNVTAWRGLSAGAVDNDVFYFFNACDIGQAGYVANFVDGWAPAVLEAGAAGFIGGLWPVFDDSAAEFAGRFYAEIERRMEDGPVSVSAVLRDLRATFAETGDPTWLSYVYYGDVNLRLGRAAAPD